VWLNIGVCGHGVRAVGDVILARSVEEAATGRTWDLVLPADCAIPADHVVTVDRAESDLPRPVGYEMEASGFLDTALALAPPDRVFVLKVVSDTRESSAAGLTADKIQKIVERSVPGLMTAMAGLAHCALPTSSRR
jgi:hypothetical protein